MDKLNFIILYVDNPLTSAEFYSGLFENAPQESHPTFVSFNLDSGITLGLWSKHTALPTASATGGGSEIAFSVPNKETVNLMYDKWTQLGARVAQKPTELDFGYTCVLLDYDDHRIRVFCSND